MEEILGLVRHGLTVAGTYVVAAGVFPQEQVDSIVGALMILIGAGWSFWNSRQKRLAAKV